MNAPAAGSSAQRGCRGSVSVAARQSRPAFQSRRGHHADTPNQAGPGAAVAAATLLSASSSSSSSSVAATVAASNTDQLHSQDPALDSLIDRWLSHKHASTSGSGQQPGSSSFAGANGSSSSNGSVNKRQQQQQSSLDAPAAAKVEWETLLGPVSATVTSLTTLEEGDEVFALSDSLSHLGGSLQELQQLATQLLHQQQQQQQEEGATQLDQQQGVAQYTQQLCQLLSTASQSAAALDDTGLINLLAIATVLLTSNQHAATGSNNNSNSSSNGHAAVHAAAIAAVQSACAELWQRPGMAANLDAAQLTSLTVVLRGLSKLAVRSSKLPVALPLSAYKQTQQLAAAGQLSLSQLGVCCWCLSGLAVAPPADAVAAALSAAASLSAAAAAASGTASNSSSSSGSGSRRRSSKSSGSSSSSDSGVDGLALRWLAAAAVNWQPWVAAGVSGTAASSSSAAAAAAAGEFVQSAAQAAVKLLESSNSSTGASSSSSSSTQGVCKVVAAVAQAAASYSVVPGEALAAAVGTKLLQQQQQQQQSAPTAAAEDADTTGAAATALARESQDIAAAAGYLLPWWASSYDSAGQELMVQAVVQQPAPVPLLHSFLAAAVHSCSATGGSTDLEQQQLHSQLELIAQHLVSGGADSDSTSHATCVALLLKLMVVTRCRSQLLLPLTQAAQHTLQDSSAGAAADTKAAAAAVAEAAAALCQLAPTGWEQQLQQLVPVLLDIGSGSRSCPLQQLNLTAVMAIHRSISASQAVAAAAAGATELAAAVLRHLLQPCTLAGASAQQAADLLVLLTVGQPPWKLSTGQQLQAAPPMGLVQLLSSSSSGAGDRGEAVSMLQQQCLRCMGVVVQDAGRSLLPGQLVPLLASLTYVQQQQQQQQQYQEQQEQQAQQWWFGTMSSRSQLLTTYRQLHREALAAVSLQLQDAASLLAPSDLAWSTRLLALLQSRPSLALGAVVQAAATCVGAFKQQDLVWMLWGLTKLRFTGEQRLQQQLLSAALQAAAAGAQVEEDEQEWQQQQGSTAWEEEQEEEGSGGSGDRSAGQFFDADVALLWVAASRGSQDPAVAQVLQHTIQAPVVPRLAQVASLVWSHTRLLQSSSGVQQHQQRPQNKQEQQQLLLEQVPRVVQLAERSLASDAAVQQLLPRHIAVLTWGLHKLGHKPSGSAVAALRVAALACAQPAQQSKSGASSSSAAAAGSFLPGELSCFLHCMASWDVQLQQEELQQLTAHVQQQLTQDLTAAGDNNSSRTVLWDGAAVCSACWSLAQLGAATPHSMLAAAEQYLLKLLPETAAAAPADAVAIAASSTQPAQQAAAVGRRQQQQQQHPSLPPSAADLVLFGTACRAAGYKPLQLLQAFRGWVLMQLAQKGPAGLVALQANFRRHKGGHASTGVQHRGSARSAPVAWRAASPAGGNSPAAQQGGQQQATASPWGNANLHAHAAVSTLLFLRQTGFDEPLLLRQLETVSLQEPVFQQLQPRQVVMLLSSFCQLGYVPEQWLGKQGVRRLTRLVLPDGPVVPSKGGATARPSSGSSSSSGESSGSNTGSSLSGSNLSAQDCVELLECLSSWCSHPQLSGNTLLWQCIFPGLLQLLLGVQYKPSTSKQAAAGAAGAGFAAATTVDPSVGPAGSNSSSSSSSSNGRGGSSPAESPSSSPAPAGPSKGSKASSTSKSTAPNLLLTMPGWQVVSVLRSLVQLDTPRAHKQLQQQVLQQLVRRLQQVWPELPLQQRVAAAHAASRAGYDLSGTLGVQELMAQHPLTPQQPPQEDRSLTPAGSEWQFATASGSSRLLWIFGNAGRHPGPQVFSTTLSAVTAAAAAAVQAGEPLPLREVSTVLYAVAVLQELQNPAVAPLLQQLQQSATQGTLLTHPQFAQQSEQLAACYLAAKDAAQAGGTPPPAPVASFDMDQGSAALAQNPGRQSNSPWLSLPGAVQQRLVEAWRRKVLRKAGPKAGNRKGMGEHMQLLLSLRQLGLRGRAKVLTDDGLVCIDVAVTTAQGDRIAVELLGPHNAALNTQRPLGPARLKWRMLAHRGYKVVVVNTWQWRTLDPGFVNRAGSSSSGSAGGGSGSGSGSSGSISSSVGGSDGAESSLEEYDGSVMSEKLLYLQSRLEAALGPAGAAALLSGGGARSLRPGPQLVRLDESGRGLVQQVVQQQRRVVREEVE